MSSTMLENILSNRNRTANLKVVFVDVTSYSKRRSITQAEVIDAFMVALDSAITGISQQYVRYAQDNGSDFQKDVICLPSGDGAAIVFPFDGTHDIHLQFCKLLLQNIYEHNGQNRCAKFENNGWCNCHDNYNISVGVSEGKGILYKDVNNNYNVAGNVINLAARLMSIAEKNQILLSEEAYSQLVDMVDDPYLDDKFTHYHDVYIKHGLKITVYQYTPRDCCFLNCEAPTKVGMQKAHRTSTLARDRFSDNESLLQLATEN